MKNHENMHLHKKTCKYAYLYALTMKYENKAK